MAPGAVITGKLIPLTGVSADATAAGDPPGQAEPEVATAKSRA
jgi:hypothetical protein